MQVRGLPLGFSLPGDRCWGFGGVKKAAESILSCGSLKIPLRQAPSAKATKMVGIYPTRHQTITIDSESVLEVDLS